MLLNVIFSHAGQLENDTQVSCATVLFVRSSSLMSVTVHVFTRVCVFVWFIQIYSVVENDINRKTVHLK